MNYALNLPTLDENFSVWLPMTNLPAFAQRTGLDSQELLVLMTVS